jgi:hypothetical protein
MYGGFYMYIPLILQKTKGRFPLNVSLLSDTNSVRPSSSQKYSEPARNWPSIKNPLNFGAVSDGVCNFRRREFQISFGD